MILGFVRALREAGLDPSAAEVADALWLAGHLDRGAPLSPVEPGGDASPSGPAAGIDPPAEAAGAGAADAGREERDAAELHPLATGDGPTPAGPTGTSFPTPAAPALTDALALARALRPLKRRVPSKREREIDEEATVRQVAEGGPWEPVLRPTRERWLEVALIVERCESTALWRSTVDELRRLVERTGAFRDVRLWTLRSVPGVGLVVAPDGAPGEARDPRELVDTSGRRLILVASDFTSGLWFTDEIRQVLAAWSAFSPTTLLSLLPERLFSQTAIGPHAGRVRALAPGSPSASLRRTKHAPSLRRRASVPLAVPVAAIESRALSSWASMVAGGGGDVPAVFLSAASAAAAEPRGADGAEDGAEGADRAAVERFRATASPLARELAGYLAAAPLTIRIMRLVQSSLLPRSSHVHLAEVFLSGLLRRARDADNPEEVLYDFVGDAREWLLNDLSVSDALQVLEGVSEFISVQLDMPNRFLSVLRDPGGEGDLQLGESERPFALVAARVLRRLGGRYARIAARLDSADGAAGAREAPAPRQAFREGADDYAVLLDRRRRPPRNPTWQTRLLSEWLTDPERGRVPPAHVRISENRRGGVHGTVDELTGDAVGRRLYLYIQGYVAVSKDGQIALDDSGGESLTQLLRGVAEARRFTEVVLLLDGFTGTIFPTQIEEINKVLSADLGIRCLIVAMLALRWEEPASVLLRALPALSRGGRSGYDLAQRLVGVTASDQNWIVAGNDLGLTFPLETGDSALVILTGDDLGSGEIRIMEGEDRIAAEARLTDGYSIVRLREGLYSPYWRDANRREAIRLDPSHLEIDNRGLVMIRLGQVASQYNFTDRVRKVLAMAQEEAIRLQHDYVGTEHILLGLIRERESIAAGVLNNLTADLDQLQQNVDRSVRRGRYPVKAGPHSYTTRARKALEFAMAESRDMHHAYVGTEHLLLGLLREEKGIAAKVLGQAGVSVDNARRELLRLLGSEPAA